MSMAISITLCVGLQFQMDMSLPERKKYIAESRNRGSRKGRLRTDMFIIMHKAERENKLGEITSSKSLSYNDMILPARLHLLNLPQTMLQPG